MGGKTVFSPTSQSQRGEKYILAYSLFQRTARLQAAGDRQDVKHQRTGGTSRSRRQAGHQEAEYRRDIKQKRTTRTSSNRRQAGHQEAVDNKDIKQQRSFRTLRLRHLPDIRLLKHFNAMCVASLVEVIHDFAA